MITKEEAWELVELQLEYQCPVQVKNCFKTWDGTYCKSAWHYGKMELRELLDAIYDGEMK